MVNVKIRKLSFSKLSSQSLRVPILHFQNMYCNETGKSRTDFQLKANKRRSKPVIKCTTNFKNSPYTHTTYNENPSKT